MNKIPKQKQLIILIFVLSSLLFSLTTEASVSAVKEKLAFDVIKGDNESPTEIRSNLSLISSGALFDYPDVRILWYSSDESIISENGRVNRPSLGEEDQTVTIAATIWRGTRLDTIEFNLTVLALQEEIESEVYNFISKLNFDLIKGNNEVKDKITENLNLVSDDSFADDLGIEVEWISDKPQYIDSQGNVRRPDFSQQDQKVRLKATIIYNDMQSTVEFPLTVLAITEPQRQPASVRIRGSDTVFLNYHQRVSHHYQAEVVDQFGDLIEDAEIFWTIEGEPVGAKFTDPSSQATTLELSWEIARNRITIKASVEDNPDIKGEMIIRVTHPPYVEDIEPDFDNDTIRISFSEPLWWQETLDENHLLITQGGEVLPFPAIAARARDNATIEIEIPVEIRELTVGDSLQIRFTDTGALTVRNRNYVFLTHPNRFVFREDWTDNDVLSFMLENIEADIDYQNFEIELIVPPDYDLTEAVPSFELSEGARAFIDKQLLQSGISVVDLKDLTSLVVEAENLDQQEYQIKVRQLTKLEILGPKQLLTGLEPLIVPYQVVLTDQFGKQISEQVEWGLKESLSGTSFDQDQQELIIEKVADEGSIVLTVNDLTQTISADYEIQLIEASEFKIEGDDFLITNPYLTQSIVLKAFAFDQKGEAIFLTNPHFEYPVSRGLTFISKDTNQLKIIIHQSIEENIDILIYPSQVHSDYYHQQIQLVKPPQILASNLKTKQGNIEVIFEEKVAWDQELKSNENHFIVLVNNEVKTLENKEPRLLENASDKINLQIVDYTYQKGDDIILIPYLIQDIIHNENLIPLSFSTAIEVKKDYDFLEIEDFTISSQLETAFIDHEKRIIMVKIAENANITDLNAEISYADALTLVTPLTEIRDFSQTITLDFLTADDETIQWQIEVSKEKSPVVKSIRLSQEHHYQGERPVIEITLITENVAADTELSAEFLPDDRVPYRPALINTALIDNNQAVIELDVNRELARGNYLIRISGEFFTDIFVSYEIK